jgi:heptosyltransferase-1
VLDTQGLVKSGLIACFARGRCYGYAAEAAREPLAAWFYDRTFVIPPNAHAVDRNRWLSAAAFDYPVDLPLDYGIAAPDPAFPWLPDGPYAILLTATSRDEKLWDEKGWIAVARHLHGLGLASVLPWGNVREERRAERIAARAGGAVVAPALPLSGLAALIGHAGLAVGVDTGLVHLAAALGVPAIAIHVATDPTRTGVLGTRNFRNLGGPGRAPAAGEVLGVIERALNPPAGEEDRDVGARH